MVLCVLACSDEPEATIPEADSPETEKLTCEDPDYSRCCSPLPALQPDGQPWPTFSEVLAEVRKCSMGSAQQYAGAEWLVGMCADGKQFITENLTFIGRTRYFEGETLVGSAAYADLPSALCICGAERFQGTLATIRCDAPVFETLCDSVTTEFQAPFSQGTADAYCNCAP